MKHSLFLFRLSIGLFMALCADAAADPDGALERSVVLLSSDQNRVCATGFFIEPSLILTNAHVALALCPLGKCEDVSVRRADAIGRPAQAETISYTALSIEKSSQSLDLAALRIMGSSVALSRSELPSWRLAPLSPQTEVRVLGFPRCGLLEVSPGTVTGLASLDIELSNEISDGSSGSPVVDSSGALVGMVSETSSLWGGVWTTLGGGRASARATNLDLARAFQEHDSFYDAAVEALLKEFETLSLLSSKNRRLYRGFWLSSRVDGLKRDLLRKFSPREALLLAELGEYPVPQREWSSPDGRLSALDKLVFLYNLEMNGPFSDIFVPLTPEKLREFLEGRGFPSSVIEWYTEKLRAVGAFRGMQMEFLMLLGWYLAIGALVSGLWCFSLGVVAAKTRGGLLRKFFVTVLVGVLLWPLSFLLFLIIRKKQVSS